GSADSLCRRRLRDVGSRPGSPHSARHGGGQLPIAQCGCPGGVAGMVQPAACRAVLERLMARLLFVTARVPFPPREGHQLRSWHLLRAAAAQHQVTLLSLRRADDPVSLPPEVTGLLADWELVDLPALRGPRHLLTTGMRWLLTRRPLLDLRYRPPALERAFQRRAAGADLIHLDMLALAGLLWKAPAKTPIILNEHNVESRLLRSRLKLEQRRSSRLLHRLQLLGLEAFERRACLRATAVLACSGLDASQVERLAPEAKIAVIPNGVDTREFSI